MSEEKLLFEGPGNALAACSLALCVGVIVHMLYRANVSTNSSPFCEILKVRLYSNKERESKSKWPPKL